MWDKLKSLVGAGSAADGGDDGHDPVSFAVAAVLVEAARMDQHFDEAEHATIARHLAERFDLAETDAHQLVADAEAEVADAAEVYGYTRTIKDAMDADERREVLQMAWEVAYTDGELHSFEANLMRRLAGLLHVGDQENGQARKAALARVNTRP